MRWGAKVLLPLVLVVSLLAGCAALGPAVGPAAIGPVAQEGHALWAGNAENDAMGGRAAPAVKPVRGTPVTDENFPALVAKYKPNELGRVLVLEYHNFKDEEERWARRWDHFRGDLQMLYDKGYRAVNLLDYLNGDMNLPAGTSPVIFTFDDGLESQVKLIQRDGHWEADPQSAVGILLQFKQEHPDFGAAGTFYVNFTPFPFGDEATWKEKVRFLVEHGFEVANHTLYHDDLSSLTDDQVRESLGEQVRLMREALPDYDGSTLALPFGISPENAALAVTGQYKGITYKHRAVLLVGADPVYSPYDKRLDVTALPRVQAIDSEFERWMPTLDELRYISDGDPDTVVIPDDMAERLNPAAVQGKHVRMYKAGS
jgi:peptidoglycan/xylan/chitin deacetylase (PgdA/CDA1 family)